MSNLKTMLKQSFQRNTRQKKLSADIEAGRIKGVPKQKSPFVPKGILQ